MELLVVLRTNGLCHQGRIGTFDLCAGDPFLSGFFDELKIVRKADTGAAAVADRHVVFIHCFFVRFIKDAFCRRTRGFFGRFFKHVFRGFYIPLFILFFVHFFRRFFIDLLDRRFHDLLVRQCGNDLRCRRRFLDVFCQRGNADSQQHEERQAQCRPSFHGFHEHLLTIVSFRFMVCEWFPSICACFYYA